MPDPAPRCLQQLRPDRACRARAGYRECAPGQEIVGEGEATKMLGSVVSVVVVLHKTLEDGRRQIVGLLFASDFIGRPLR